MEYTLHAATVVDALPAHVFARITDIDRLPDWNTEIATVVERPAALGVGAEWVVEIRAMGTRWNSRAHLTELDPEGGRFAYRSQTDDGNPSYADWRWRLTPAPAGTRVDVEVDIRPRTFWRIHLLSNLRNQASTRPCADRSMPCNTSPNSRKHDHERHDRQEVDRLARRGAGVRQGPDRDPDPRQHHVRPHRSPAGSGRSR